MFNIEICTWNNLQWEHNNKKYSSNTTQKKRKEKETKEMKEMKKKDQRTKKVSLIVLFVSFFLNKKCHTYFIVTFFLKIDFLIVI